MCSQAICQGGSFALESVAAFVWNGWQAWCGIRIEERLAAHPELKQQLLTLLELAESNIDSADRVEELTVEGIKTFGQQVMQDWAQRREEEK